MFCKYVTVMLTILRWTTSRNIDKITDQYSNPNY